MGVALVTVTLLAGCGGSTAAWETPKDVIDSLKEAGFECKNGSEGPDVRPPKGGDPSTAVVCDGFRVTFWSDADTDAVGENVRMLCANSSQRDWDDWAGVPIVRADTWLVFPRGDWPEQAEPEDFQKAFGGTVQTLTQLLESVGCERPGS